MLKNFLFFIFLILILLSVSCTGTQSLRVGGVFQDKDGNKAEGEIEYIWNRNNSQKEEAIILTSQYGDNVIVPVADIENAYKEKVAALSDTSDTKVKSLQRVTLREKLDFLLRKSK